MSENHRPHQIFSYVCNKNNFYLNGNLKNSNFSKSEPKIDAELSIKIPSKNESVGLGAFIKVDTLTPGQIFVSVLNRKWCLFLHQNKNLSLMR